MSDQITPAVERAATAYLHMVPHCDGCAKESKGLLRRCSACKDLAVEFALHMLAAALDVEEMAHALDGHRPVMSVLDGIIRITGCRCLDRVFFRNSGEASESWEGHIAASLRTALLGADS